MIMKDRMIMSEFEFFQVDGEVCSKIARDKIIREMLPELHWLCCIALSILCQPLGHSEGFYSMSCQNQATQ